ncbi:transcription termination/antitermination protein NusA [Lujinxingia vulgaris]|uniref:Transcription termination/antitermination protein NusA n=1 Tax=Lujinxingia vulgaris TaxID=2600176 RepID=A0A5C6XT99_9DELT|nr:transcription termination factor NusA [Lujinxingia vulgaris]TXD43718.1 transcription termination/antitermination protein NusA [Lujinxingia vulgaris]
MNLNSVIEEVGRTKGIDRSILVETLEAAILTAARRTYGAQREIEAEYNEESGEVQLFQIITVSDDVENPYREVSVEEVREAGFEAEPGDELLFQIFYREDDKEKAKAQDKRYGKLLKLDSYNSTFGRIAAQTAKQVIIQRVREAERDIIYDEYKDTVGDMVIGRVRRFEKGNIIVDLGRTDAILPRREQTPRESYRPGDRLQAMIKEVQKSSRDPQVVLTRADPMLLLKLFEQEVPEIHEGAVRIVAVAREPGVRTKVAVYSRDSDVDPVGACVGMRGSRVQAVVQELRGEKIDIVPYVEDTARFVCNAISPAEVAKVLIDESNMTMELIVPDDQLSLAIGRGGQNVRLAAQLTGWNLDIISETRLKNMMAESRAQLLEFEGITEDMVDTLFTLGYNKLEHMAHAAAPELAQIPGLNAESAERIIAAAAEILARPAPGSPEAMTEADYERKALEDIRGVGTKVAASLHDSGYISVEHIAFAEDASKLAEAAGLGKNVKKAKQILSAAEDHLKRELELDDEAFEARRAEFKAAQAEGAASGDEAEAAEAQDEQPATAGEDTAEPAEATKSDDEEDA